MNNYPSVSYVDRCAPVAYQDHRKHLENLDSLFFSKKWSLTVNDVISNDHLIHRFNPCRVKELYHAIYPNTEGRINIDTLDLERQRGRTCLGNAIYTCSRFAKHKNIRLVDRHELAETVFRLVHQQSDGKRVRQALEPVLGDRYKIPIEFYGPSRCNREFGECSVSSYLLKLLDLGPVAAKVRHSSTGNHGFNHAISILGYCENEQSFIVSDSSNIANLFLLHEKILDNFGRINFIVLPSKE